MKSYNVNNDTDKIKRKHSYNLSINQNDSEVVEDETKSKNSNRSYDIDILDEKKKAYRDMRRNLAEKADDTLKNKDENDHDTYESNSKDNRALRIIISILVMSACLIISFISGSMYTVTTINKQIEAERAKDAVIADKDFYFTEIPNTSAYAINKDDVISFLCDARNADENVGVKIEYVIDDITDGITCTSDTLYGGEIMSWQPSFNIVDTDTTHIIRITQNAYSADDTMCKNCIGTQEVEIAVSINSVDKSYPPSTVKP